MSAVLQITQDLPLCFCTGNKEAMGPRASYKCSLHREVLDRAIPGKPVCITLFDSFTYFELHVKAPNVTYPELCPMIWIAIFSGLKAAACSLRYIDFVPHLACFCKCSLSHPHNATPTMDEKTSTCYALKSIAYEPLIKCYTVWLGLKLAANQEKCQLVPCNNKKIKKH